MKKFFKRLFCRHHYRLVDMYVDHEIGFVYYYFECTKCGKKWTRYGHYNPYIVSADDDDELDDKEYLTTRDVLKYF